MAQKLTRPIWCNRATFKGKGSATHDLMWHLLRKRDGSTVFARVWRLRKAVKREVPPMILAESCVENATGNDKRTIKHAKRGQVYLSGHWEVPPMGPGKRISPFVAHLAGRSGSSSIKNVNKWTCPLFCDGWMVFALCQMQQ